MQSVKVRFNLASHPFGHRRLFWLLSGVSAALLFGVGVFLVVTYSQNHDLSPEWGAREAELRAELKTLREEETALTNKLQEPGNDQVLVRSLFLNQLLLRKGISWTRTFADLEKVLPPRVRMVQIRPEVTPDNKVLLDMYVGAEKPQDFILFLQALESSQWFGSPDMRSSAPPTENNPLYQYQLMVSYDQRL